MTLDEARAKVSADLDRMADILARHHEAVPLVADTIAYLRRVVTAVGLPDSREKDDLITGLLVERRTLGEALTLEYLYLTSEVA